MYTYQDLASFIEKGASESDMMEFVRSIITLHKSTDLYKYALIAEDYDRKINRTITDYQKILYTISGDAVPDNDSANYKMSRGFFPYFVTQEVQYLLGNGVTWNNSATEDKLGTKKRPFDHQLQEAGHNALVGAVSFGFFNLDHIDVFKVTEFAPLQDEETGALRAGVRFWQIDETKPLRATLYEEDGYTNYIWKWRKDGKTGTQTEVGEVLTPKTPYKQHVSVTQADGIEIMDGENYPGFPIVPLWGNKHHQSELVGLREQIDCYDLIKSGFANTVDEASIMYWAIQNAGGMDDIDLQRFVNHMKTVHAAVLEDNGSKAEAHTMDAPYQSRETLLDRLEKDIFKDAMALDVEHIASGATTATQIRAAYEPLNEKTDGFEYCISDFVMKILEIAGIDDEPTFTRSTIINAQEEINYIIASAEYLTEDYVTEKILTILGDKDKYEDIQKQKDADELNRGGLGNREGVDENYQMNEIPSTGSQNLQGEYTENRQQ